MTAAKVLLALGLMTSSAWAAPISGTASWYDIASTVREGTGGSAHLTASGEPLNDAALTCALRSHQFGQSYRVCRVDQPSRCVVVRHNDFGPGRRPTSRGVVIDLSRAAFLALSPLTHGLVNVTVERVTP